MRLARLLMIALLGGASFASLACEVPSLPVFPDDERIRGRAERELKDDMVRYITAMSVYVACVQSEFAAAERDNAPERHLALLAARNNDAVAELESVRDIYVSRVGPIEDLFFEQSFAGGDSRRNMRPGSVPAPAGPDSVLRRTEIILGGDLCPEISACSKDVTAPGMERNVRPLTAPTRSNPDR